MKINILDIIRCPKCYGDLGINIIKSSEDIIIEGELTCKLCGEKYPVIEEIPYLAVIVKAWYPKIQEIIARRDISSIEQRSKFLSF